MTMIPRLFLSGLTLFLAVTATADPIHHYVFFNLDREAPRQETFLSNPVFEGAQLKFTWRELEPEKDRYAFDELDQALSLLGSRGKKLFLQLQDVSFSEKIVNVPEYLRADPAYHGGADRQYEFKNEKDETPVPAGWVARRWDPAVQDRFERLLLALGSRFDGRLAGLALPETAVEFGTTGKYWPTGFTPASYPQAILARLSAAKKAFRRSVVLQYTNFFPGEWLPWDDKGYQNAVWSYAAANGIAVGGPDFIPYRKGQMAHSYHFAELFRGRVVTGYAVQEGNYSQPNARTGKRMTVGDLLAFARELGVSYLFWYPEAPYFERDVLPALKAAR